MRGKSISVQKKPCSLLGQKGVSNKYPFVPLTYVYLHIQLNQGNADHAFHKI